MKTWHIRAFLLLSIHGEKEMLEMTLCIRYTIDLVPPGRCSTDWQPKVYIYILRYQY